MEAVSFIAGVFTGLWAWPILTAIVVLFVCAIGLAYEHEGWVSGGLAVIVVGTVFAFWTKLSWADIAYYVGLYALIGAFMTYPLYHSYSRRKTRVWRTYLDRFANGMTPIHTGHPTREDFLKKWYVDNLSQEALNKISKSYNYCDVADYKKVSSPENDTSAQAAWIKHCHDSMISEWNHHNYILQVADIGDATKPLWDVTHQKGALVGQMMLWWGYWPSYTVAMLLRDVVRNFWEWVIEHIGGHFARMSTAHFNNA